MPDLGVGEILIILLVVVVLFGSAKLPGLARSLGQSMRILKAETKGLRDDEPEQSAKQQPKQQDAKQPEPAPQQQQQNYQPQPQRELTVGSDSGEPISGVPVADAERRRQS